ncbi:MAG: hypothetical protein K2Q22_15580, partial [Cytophagales bacterium]|nr:hypothetical protein [Cytophagales bacterium]
MSNKHQIESLLEKLNGYKKLYFFNAFVRGALISLLALSIAFVAINSAEYWGRLPSLARTGLFFSYVALSAYFLTKYVVLPLIQLARFKSNLSDEKAADQIGAFFPEVKDKLVNVVQLNKTEKSALVEASLSQKAFQLSDIQFDHAINLNQNFRFARWLVFPLGLMILLYLMLPGFFTESTTRLIKFRTEFTPPPPFSFVIENNS